MPVISTTTDNGHLLSIYKFSEYDFFRIVAEESARTEEDFKEVIRWWDRLDANRERKERDHETGRSTVPLEWGADELYCSGRPSYDVILRRLLLAGDFLDFIFDHPETIHELVTDTDLSKILKELKPHLKNLLYYLFLRDYSTSKYAESIGQSDRNIRGIRETVLKKIRQLYSKMSGLKILALSLR